MASNLSLCRKCRTRVPVSHVIREGKVFLHADCPDCGPGEVMVSSDAASWQRKRDLWKYDPAAAPTCAMNCDSCGKPHEPTIAFVDITNRCNMMCPICIANIRGMGYEFNPPLEYFEKLFAALGQMDPVPLAELFGGEPTMRSDLLEIIAIARKHGVKSRVVTNGLRLADEEYCKKLCEAGVRFQVGIDGRNPEIYSRMRKNPKAFEKKMKGLANLKKYSRRKNAILCCAARKINEDYIGDLIECCHEMGDAVDSLGLLPLTEMWDEGTFEADVQTTREDVEHMVERAVVGGQVEFIPAGVTDSLRRARKFLKPRSSSDALMFGGVHPDCETMTMLVSDGQHYRSINHYLKIPLSRVGEMILERSRQVAPKLARLDPRRRSHLWRAKLLLLRAYGPLFLRAVAWRRVPRGNPIAVLFKMLGGILAGRKPADVARQHLNLSRILRVATLPFEESHSIDAQRLHNCKAVFAFEDVDTGTIRTVPACTWAGIYRNTVLKKVAAKYNSRTDAEGDANAVEPQAVPSIDG